MFEEPLRRVLSLARTKEGELRFIQAEGKNCTPIRRRSTSHRSLMASPSATGESYWSFSRRSRHGPSVNDRSLDESTHRRRHVRACIRPAHPAGGAPLRLDDCEPEDLARRSGLAGVALVGLDVLAGQRPRAPGRAANVTPSLCPVWRPDESGGDDAQAEDDQPERQSTGVLRQWIERWVIQSIQPQNSNRPREGERSDCAPRAENDTQPGFQCPHWCRVIACKKLQRPRRAGSTASPRPCGPAASKAKPKRSCNAHQPSPLNKALERRRVHHDVKGLLVRLICAHRSHSELRLVSKN